MTNKKNLALLFGASFLFFAVTGIFAGNQAADRIMDRYSASSHIDLLGVFDHVVILCTAALFASILTGVVFLFRLNRQRRKKQRVANLTAYLRQMNEGKYSLRPMVKEDELSSLEDELYKTLILLREGRESAQAEKENLAKNLSDIAHQLKTPLASISLMSDLLATETSGRLTEYTAHISTQAERLNLLVSTLLALSRLDAGTLTLKRKPVDVREMIESVRESLLPFLENKHQTLLLPDTEAMYLGDFYWSTQAFINILRNCCEYTPVGGELMVSWEEGPLCTLLMIEDNGDGIPTDDLPHLFTRFYRGKNAGADSAGIGLSLAKAIIVEQNGDLTAENRSNGGALFTAKFYHHI
ncbi:MAG: HAMP domain-containing histidine kinase [Lachnospiraceae bacterium]|jgi:signal transduction histidine kinase|nr:HAMP domain-containing histidine kinase [Lachnospiraceae bacterium]